jgi:hypothetical protein
VSESVPEAVAEQAWRRYRAGELGDEISRWLAQVGYAVTPDEVLVIAYEHECDTADRESYG